MPSFTQHRMRRETPLWHHRITDTRPSYIDGLTAWYDFSDPTTITETDDAISAVADKSASGFTLTQTTAANRPTLVEDVVGQRSVGRFARPSAGNCDWLISTSLGAAFTGTDIPMTVFFAGQASSVFRVEAWCFTNAGGSEFIELYTTNPTPDLWIADADDGPTYGGSGVIEADTDWHVHVVTYDGATLTNYVDGGTPDTFSAAWGDIDLTRFHLGTYDGGVGSTDFFWEGDIGEVLVYDSVLSTANLNKAGRYLADRWGTTWSDVT